MIIKDNNSEDKLELRKLINTLEVVLKCPAGGYNVVSLPRDLIEEILNTLVKSELKLNTIENIAADSFNSPVSLDVNLYRLQALVTRI